jgi:Uma2 family endonuclease
MSTASSHLLTAEDLLKMPNDRRRELVRGELREMAPAGFDHGAVIGKLSYLLSQHVYGKGLGLILGAETGFKLERNPDTLRGADTAFVSAERVSMVGRPKGFWPGGPDLAVEVVSPGDTVEEVEEKVDDYLRAGTPLVWVINPRRRTVTIHRPDDNPVVLRENDTLTGGAVLPEFSCRVGDIFE